MTMRALAVLAALAPAVEAQWAFGGGAVTYSASLTPREFSAVCAALLYEQEATACEPASATAGQCPQAGAQFYERRTLDCPPSLAGSACQPGGGWLPRLVHCSAGFPQWPVGQAGPTAPAANITAACSRPSDATLSGAWIIHPADCALVIEPPPMDRRPAVIQAGLRKLRMTAATAANIE